MVITSFSFSHSLSMMNICTLIAFHFADFFTDARRYILGLCNAPKNDNHDRRIRRATPSFDSVVHSASL